MNKKTAGIIAAAIFISILAIELAIGATLHIRTNPYSVTVKTARLVEGKK